MPFKPFSAMKEPRRKLMNIRIAIAMIFGMAVVVFLYKRFAVKPLSSQLVFSPRTMIMGLWNNYRTTYVMEGRTLDPSKNSVTTSEGQSYTMLRAVWVDDKQTFDKTWKWTEANLKRPTDNLFSWLYGKRPDGSFGVIEENGGGNSAADADTDISLALLFGSYRWSDPSYMDSAKTIISDIWTREVASTPDGPVLVANNLEKKSQRMLVNPSYFAPYAYRAFAVIDKTHDWKGLLDNSYKIIQKSSGLSLDASSSSNLPPDWILVDRLTGEISETGNTSLQSTYGYEAARVPWRLALDYVWYKDGRDKSALDKFSFLGKEWVQNGEIYATYAHGGEPIGKYEAPMIYGGSLGYFLASDEKLGSEIYLEKLQGLFDPGTLVWKKPMGYYDANWAWFGLAIYNDMLPNLAPSSTSLAYSQ